MASYSVAHAKDHLSELLSAAERGEEVKITRYGRPIVALVPAPASVPGQASPVSHDSLEKLWEELDRIPMRMIDGAAIVSGMRDQDSH